MAPKLLQTPIPLLFFIAALFLMLSNKVHSQDTISFSYDSFASNTNGLTYQGDAFVPSGSKFVRLTKTNASGLPTTYSVGRVLFSPPLQFWEPGRQASFFTTITFIMSFVDNDPADGLTFFIAPVNSAIPPGSTGGNYGIFDPSTGDGPGIFAVEFNVLNRRIGICIESRTPTNVTSFENASGQVVTAFINYFSDTRTISVTASYGSQTSVLNHVFDLKTILPQQVQLGISAGTGNKVALFDLHSWFFSSNLNWEGSSIQHKGNNHNKYIRQYVV